MRVKGRHHFLKISLSIFTVALLLFMGLQTIYANPVSIDASGISNNYFSAPGSQQMTPLTGQSHVNNQTQSTSSDTTCKTCSHSNCIKPQNKYPTKSRSLFIHSHSVPAQDASNETNLTFEVTNLSLGMSWNIVIFRSSISLETYISDKFCSPYYAKSTSSTSLSILIPSGTYFYAFGPLNTYFGMYKLYAHGKTEIVNLTLPTLYQVKFKVTNQPTNIDTSFEIVDSFPPPTIEIAYYNSSTSNITIAYLPKLSYCLSYGPESTLFQYGLLNVNSSTSINLTLKKTFEVNLTFVNKPKNAALCIIISPCIHNICYRNASNSSKMVAYLPNCTFGYRAILENSMTYNYGKIDVQGKPENVTIYLKQTYNVTFSLASSNVNSCWFIALCGHITSNCYVSSCITTTGSQICLLLTNASYSVYHGYYYPCLIRPSYLTGDSLYRSGSTSFNVTGTSLSFEITLPKLYEVSFEAKNLMFTGDWSISFTLGLNTGTIDSGIFNLSLPNGTYYFVASELDYSNSGAFFVVNGGNITEDIAFPKLYSLNLEASELPNNAQWCVTVYNDSLSFSYKNSSDNPDMTAYVPNGTYNYTYGLSYGDTNAILGRSIIAASGSARSLCLLIPEFYSVNITEQNLIYPRSWSVAISNSNGSINYKNTSASQMMKAYLPQGTFNYTSQTTYLNGPRAEFNISINTTLQLVFPKSFRVNFTEENLLNNTFWSICISGSNLRRVITNYTCGTNMTEYLPVGIYNYSSYTRIFNKLNGEVSINGNVTVYVVFPMAYNVTFYEKVLPIGTRWDLFFNGKTLLNSYDSSEGNNLSQYFINGTYTYTACAFDFSFAKVNFTVNGSSELIKVNIQQFYTIKFQQHNAPLVPNSSYCCWKLRVCGPDHYYYAQFVYTSNVTILLPNGTFSYRAFDSYQLLNLTEFNVTGKNMTVEVYFSELFKITVDETGFSRLKGNCWYAIFTGNNSRIYYRYTNSSTITAVGPNGTFLYFISYISDYEWCVNPENGTFVINGHNITLHLQFKQVFQVSFLYEISGAKFYWTLSDLYDHFLPPDNATSKVKSIPICTPPADKLTSEGVLLTIPMFSRGYAHSEAMRSIQSFTPPFTVRVNASVLAGSVNALQIMLYNLNQSKHLGITEGSLLMNGEISRGIAYYLSNCGKCVASGILNRSADYGAVYNYVISVNETGFANITILLGNSSVGFVRGINVSKGPFYVAIGQSDFPASDILPVALLESVSVTCPDNRSSPLNTTFSNPALELKIDGHSYGAFLNSTHLMLPNGTYQYSVVYCQSGVTYCNNALAITIASGNLTVNGHNVSITVKDKTGNSKILGLNATTFYTIIFILIASILITGVALFYYKKRLVSG
jgi:hypothetical protein